MRPTLTIILVLVALTASTVIGSALMTANPSNTSDEPANTKIETPIPLFDKKTVAKPKNDVITVVKPKVVKGLKTKRPLENIRLYSNTKHCLYADDNPSEITCPTSKLPEKAGAMSFEIEFKEKTLIIKGEAFTITKLQVERNFFDWELDMITVLYSKSGANYYIAVKFEAINNFYRFREIKCQTGTEDRCYVE